MIGVFSFILRYGLLSLNSILLKSEEKLKKIIYKQFDYIYTSAPDIKDEKKIEHSVKRAELVNEAVENV